MIGRNRHRHEVVGEQQHYDQERRDDESAGQKNTDTKK